MRSFESEPTSIGDFFNQKDTLFRVPLYQREYSWSEENIENLLEDLFSGETYFFGTFVLNNEHYRKEKIKDIVDGQQRILTVTIFFAVIRDMFLELKDKQKSEQIQSKYISDKDDDGKDKFKVIVGNSARVFFEKYIQRESTKIEESSPETKEHRKILESYQKIKSELLRQISCLETTGEKIEKLRDIREALKNLELIVIEVGSEEDAFTFFETLNSRGTDLTQSDLIKNLIFKNIGKENSTTEREWQKIKDFVTADDSTEITTFIRHYWLSTRKKVTEKNLFRAIKKSDDIKDYQILLSQLVDEADRYRLIISPSSSEWENEYLGVYKALKRMKALNIRQSRSIILSLVRILRDAEFWSKYKTSEVIKAFDVIEKFTFSFSTITKKSPSKLENIYSDYGVRLHNEYLRPGKHVRSNIDRVLKDFKNKLLEIYPTESEFKDNFIKIEYKKSTKQIALIRYILERLNYGDNTEQLFDNVNLEHVLPQNPEGGWGLSKDEIESYVNKIGNIIPLGAEYNQDASNLVISKKLDMYKKTGIKMSRDFLNFLEKNNHVWTEREIVQRTEKLACVAWNLWGPENL